MTAFPKVRKPRVLVVSDQQDKVLTLGILLRSEGIDVRLATGGSEVPAAVAKFEPDAVLLDPAMPAKTGLAVAKELMRCCGDRCPLLHHVKKPLDPDALLKLVLSITPK